MISLEQVLLLETKVAKAIDYVKKVTTENAELILQKEELMVKLEANQKRIDELEVLVMRFKEDHSRIEDGIIAALDRLSQFEEAFENSLANSGASGKDKVSEKKPVNKPQPQETSEEPVSSAKQTAVSEDSAPDSKEVFFEIPDKETEVSSEENELDIF